MDRLTCRLNNQLGEPTSTVIMDYRYAYLSKEKQFDLLIHCVNSYELTGLTPEEITTLKSESEQNQTYADIYKDICDKYGKNFRELMEKAKGLVKERDTLKKALELACDDAADGCCPHEVYSFDCGKVRACPNQAGDREDSGIDKKCWYDYYIQQAQEQEGNHHE